MIRKYVRIYYLQLTVWADTACVQSAKVKLMGASYFIIHIYYEVFVTAWWEQNKKKIDFLCSFQ